MRKPDLFLGTKDLEGLQPVSHSQVVEGWLAEVGREVGAPDVGACSSQHTGGNRCVFAAWALALSASSCIWVLPGYRLLLSPSVACNEIMHKCVKFKSCPNCSLPYEPWNKRKVHSRIEYTVVKR